MNDELGGATGAAYAGSSMAMPEPPDFSVSVEIDVPVAILTITGDLDLAGSDEARTAADGALADPAIRHACVDLSRSQFVDSSGVAVLTRMLTTAEERGGRVVLVAHAPAILRTLALLGLDEALEIAPARDEALARLAAVPD